MALFAGGLALEAVAMSGTGAARSPAATVPAVSLGRSVVGLAPSAGTGVADAVLPAATARQLAVAAMVLPRPDMISPPIPTIPLAPDVPIAALALPVHAGLVVPRLGEAVAQLQHRRQRVHFEGHARNDCLPASLMTVIYDVAERFGAVRIISTYRDRRHNARVGGATRSMHLDCRAIDFIVSGNRKGLIAYLRTRPEVGGIGYYPGSHLHIDDGAHRSW